MLVLLVEDDHSIAHALDLALRKQGYSVNTVETGGAAVLAAGAETAAAGAAGALPMLRLAASSGFFSRDDPDPATAGAGAAVAGCGAGAAAGSTRR